MFLRSGTTTDLEQIYNLTFKNAARCFTWGDDGLDYRMPLLRQGHFAVIAGAEGSGKTTWSIEMALQNARNGKVNEKPFYCGYLSLEMLPHRIVALYAQRKTQVKKEDIRNNFTLLLEGKEDLEARYMAAAKEFLDSNLCLFYNEDSEVTGIEYIENVCNQENRPDILFIDNLNEITVKNMSNEYERFDLILRELHRMKKQYNVAFVLLHHLAKAKQGEPISNNNIKGNNIVITKPDITVIIDKSMCPNFNWICPIFNNDGKIIKKKDRKAFMAEAPLTEYRKVDVKKDRDTDERGVKGYLSMPEGVIMVMDEIAVREKYPLSPKEKEYYRQMLAEKNASPESNIPDSFE